MIAGYKLTDTEELKVYVNDNTNVVQSNYLISHKEHWTVAEERVFMTVLAMVNKGDEALHRYKIPVKTLVDLWGVNPKNVSTEIQTVLRSLQLKGIYRPSRGISRFPALINCHYEPGDEYALVQIFPELQAHIIDIKAGGGYTKYRLENALKLNRANAGVYANRIYELCRSYARAGKTIEKTFSIEDIRQILDLGTKYSQLRGLNERVLTPSIIKINENTDLSVFHEIQGRGKKAAVVFTITLIEEATETPADIPEAPPAPAASPKAPALDFPADWAEDYKELMQGCYDMMAPITEKGVSFTLDELRFLADGAFAHGASDIVEYMDYFTFQTHYVMLKWPKIKQKKAYIKKAFKGNYGEWSKM